MITPTLNSDGITGHILIEPNRPISWRDNMRFIKWFALVSFIIALVAMLRGFLLVMPYSGLEVIFVSACLYLVYKHYTICQVIYFTDDSVIIESGKYHAENRVEYQRHWSKFLIDNKDNHTIPRLRISSKGKQTEIGAFLNYQDKLILIDLIRNITAAFQSQKY